jgi:hypothetical protein
MVQGLTLERTYLGPTLIKMRGTLEDMCIPAFYFNGMYMRDVNADDINDWVHPEEIAGIEIYTETTLPPQFHSRLSGCGSILIWTK